MTLKIGHVGLNVSDLERSQAFYSEVFGLETIHEAHSEGRHYAFLQGGDGILLTLWQQSAGEFSKQTPGLHHLAFRVASADEVRTYETKVRALGVTPLHDGAVANDTEQDFGGLYFLDPDGIRLEISAPTGFKDHATPTPGFSACGFF